MHNSRYMKMIFHLSRQNKEKDALCCSTLTTNRMLYFPEWLDLQISMQDSTASMEKTAPETAPTPAPRSMPLSVDIPMKAPMKIPTSEPTEISTKSVKSEQEQAKV